jgi:hypothetical protein
MGTADNSETSLRIYRTTRSYCPKKVSFFNSKTNQKHSISNLFYFGCMIAISFPLFHLVPTSKQPQNLYDLYLMVYVQS